jgi:hypothetical protein
VSVGVVILAAVGRHAAFRFTVDASAVEVAVLRRHVGAARFAYNQCVRLVKDASAARAVDAQVAVPWSGFDLINAFGQWKRSGAAGRVIAAEGPVTNASRGDSRDRTPPRAAKPAPPTEEPGHHPHVMAGTPEKGGVLISPRQDL